MFAQPCEHRRLVGAPLPIFHGSRKEHRDLSAQGLRVKRRESLQFCVEIIRNVSYMKRGHNTTLSLNLERVYHAWLHSATISRSRGLLTD